MAVAFTRSLGNEAGVQLNDTVDNSGGFAGNTVEDQTFACAVRTVRGPIDRAFMAYKSNVLNITGRPQSHRQNILNDGHGMLIEALKRGARGAVVSRLVGADVSNQWVLVKENEVKGDNWEYSFELVQEIPEEPFIFAFKHKGCFSDGIKVSLSAKEKLDDEDQPIDNDMVTFKILDKSGNMVLGFSASLSLDNVDDYGLPNNLQTIAEKYNADDIEIVLADNAKISKDSAAYGKDDNGLQQIQTSRLLFPFQEGDVSSLTVKEYQEAVKRLHDTTLDYVYISSMNSESVALISELQMLAHARNIESFIDVPGYLTPKQAIAWKNQTGIKTHLATFTWCPIECLDPNGVSGRVMFGASAYRVALSCYRNAKINAYGFPMKQQAIAGRDYPLQRTGMKLIYKPSQPELSDLATNGINPVIYASFTGGGAYIFADVVTAKGRMDSYLNLISSTECITTLERNVGRMAHESFMFGPMQEAIEVAKREIKKHFEHAETSGWLVKSNELDGNAFIIDVRASEQRPADVMIVEFKCHVDGCVRQVHITSEITR